MRPGAIPKTSHSPEDAVAQVQFAAVPASSERTFCWQYVASISVLPVLAFSVVRSTRYVCAPSYFRDHHSQELVANGVCKPLGCFIRNDGHELRRHQETSRSRSSSSLTVLSLPAFSCKLGASHTVSSFDVPREAALFKILRFSAQITSAINLRRTIPFRKCFGLFRSCSAVYESMAD